jgi:hypothetical protein
MSTFKTLILVYLLASSSFLKEEQRRIGHPEFSPLVFVSWCLGFDLVFVSWYLEFSLFSHKKEGPLVKGALHKEVRSVR